MYLPVNSCITDIDGLDRDTYSITVINAGCKSDYELKKDTPYLALTGELWSISCE